MTLTKYTNVNFVPCSLFFVCVSCFCPCSLVFVDQRLSKNKGKARNKKCLLRFTQRRVTHWHQFPVWVMFCGFPCSFCGFIYNVRPPFTFCGFPLAHSAYLSTFVWDLFTFCGFPWAHFADLRHLYELLLRFSRFPWAFFFFFFFFCRFMCICTWPCHVCADFYELILRIYVYLYEFVVDFYALIILWMYKSAKLANRNP